MLSKNNHKIKKEKQANRFQRFGIKKLSVGVASVAIAAGIIFASDVQLAQAAGTVDAVNGKLEITPEQQAEVTAIHEAKQVATPTMKTTTDPVTGQNIPADGGVAQMIETSKELRIKNPELAKELEAQSDNGPSGAVVSTEPAPTEPALTAPAKVENAERTDDTGQVYTGQPLDNNALDSALDVNNPAGTHQDDGIVGYAVDLGEFSDPAKAGQSKLKIINRVHLSEAMPAKRYEVRYEIDDRVARHITDLKYLKSEGPGVSDRDFSMTRLKAIDDPNKLTNTWSMTAFDVDVASSDLLGTNFDSMFMTTGKAPATIEMSLDTTWKNIVDAHPEARDNNDLFFNAYLWDTQDNKVLEGTINSTYFQTKPNALDKRQSAGYAQEVNGNIEFTVGQAQYVEGGTVDPYTGQFDENAKVRGVAVDQTFARDNLEADMSVPTTYHFQADERLVPYIKGVGVYYLDHEGRHMDRKLNPKNQVFYNGLILNDDKSGILSTLPIAKPNERLKGNADQYYMDYDPKTGSGHFKLDPDANGKLQWNSENVGALISPAGVRVVYYLKDDVNINNLKANNLDKHYSFDGYFLDNTGKYVRNTEGKIAYNFGDFKGDPSPITNKGNPGVDDTTRTNPKDQELPEVKTPTYIAQAEPKTVLLNTKVTAEDLIKAQAVDADGQPVDFPEGTVFQFVKVDAEGKFVEDLKDKNGKDLKALDTSQVGLQEVNIRVTLPRQSTSRIISGLVQVNKRPGESGQKLSEEQFIPMTNSGSRNEFNSEGFLNNVFHQMETKLTSESQAENEIDVTVSSLIHLIPSESEDTLKKWDYVIEFSDNVAKHIVSIENSKGGEFERIVNRNGDLTNSWKMRAWGGDADSRSLMTNTAVGAGYNYPVKVTLDTSVTAVLDEVKADLGREVTNGDIDSTAYVYNNAEKAIVDGSYSSTFLKVQPTEYDALEATDKPVWNNWFELSSGRVKYFEGNSISPYTGLTGDKVRGFAVDQFFEKSGGSSLNTLGATTDPLHYHYTVDKRLIPYLESASLYYIPNGKDNYNNSAVGKDFSYIPQAQVFFNGQDPEWDEFRNEFDPTTGQGTFKLDPDTGTIARLINFDNSHLDPGAARIVYTLRDGVTLNDILKDNPDATYAFTGYLALDSGPKVRNSNANIGYTISDINGDGIADEWQNVQYKDLSDHEKAILTPIETALVDKGLTGTNANVLVTEARANDNSVEGLLNVGYNEGEARTVVVETVNETGTVVKLGEAAVDPITGKFTINFTDPNAKLVEGQELLLSVVNEGKTVAANVQTVKAPDQIVKSYNNVVDLVQPTPESQEVVAGKAIQNVQLETFTELADADKPADVTIPAYDGTTDTNILKFVSYTQKGVTEGVTGDPTTDVAEANQATLPAGLSIVDGVLQGTPKITDWDEGETERVLTFVEDATNDKEGNATDRTFTITVKRSDISKPVDPRYKNTETKPGVEVKTDEPTFVEEGTETLATKPEGTKFETGTNVPTDKGDITIDENTGVVTYKPAPGIGEENPEKVEIPVKVTYPDEPSEETTVTITVGKDVYDRGNNEGKEVPEGYTRVVFKTNTNKGTINPGESTVFDVKDGHSLPEDKLPKVTANAGYIYKPGRKGWTPEVPEKYVLSNHVTTDPKRGYSEHNAKYTDAATAKEADKHDVAYPPKTTTPDAPVTSTPGFTDLITGNPKATTDVPLSTAGDAFTPGQAVDENGNNVQGSITVDQNTGAVTYTPDANLALDNPVKVTIPVTVKYIDGSDDVTDLVVTVGKDVYDRGDNDDGSGGDKHPVPEGYYRVTVQPDEHLQFKDKADKKRQVYDVKKAGTVDVSGLVFEAKAEHKKDYKPELKDGKQVYDPAVTDLTISSGGNYTAKETKTDQKTEAEQHNPSYPDVEGKPGTTITIPNTGDKLPQGTTIEVTGPEGYVTEVVPGTETEDSKIKVTIPETSKLGDKVELEVEVTYPDGSKDTPTETLDKDDKPIEGAPENLGLTPKVTTDKGDSAKGKPGETVPIKDEKDQPIGPGTTITENPDKPNETGIKVVEGPDGEPQVEIPEDKEPGNYEVPVIIEKPVNPEDPNGPKIKEETTITVTVPPYAEQLTPSYPDVGGKPGTVIEIPNTGDKLPEGTEITVTGPEGYVVEVIEGNDKEDPKIKVTIPETSKPGDKVELEVEVTYPDGSKDTPTETLDKDGQPIEGAPANPGLTPEVTTDKGDSAEGKPGDTVPIKDEKDLPIGPGTKIEEKPGNDTGITIKDTPEGPQVVIPEGKESGTYLVPVIITHDNGVIEETTIAVEVTPLPGLTDLTVNPVNEGDTVVTGTTEPGASVEVTLPGAETPITTTADDKGNFSVEVPETVELKVDDVITVTATGTDKLPTTTEVTVGKRDVTPAPVVNPITEGDTTITGTTEPGASVTAELPGQAPITTTADDKGNFSVEVPKDVTLKVGDEVLVTATEAGKKPGSTTAVVQAKPASGKPVEKEADPAKPVTTPTETPAQETTALTVDPISEGDKVVTGTTEPGANVTVQFPGADPVQTVADVTGKFKVAVPAGIELKAGDQVTVTAVADGKKPATVTVTVQDTTSKADKQADPAKKEATGETLPETGEGYLLFGAAATSILAGLGLVNPKRKREED